MPDTPDRFLHDCAENIADDNGQTLRYREWRPANGAEPRGGVLLCHGYGEHCGRYGRMARGLNAAGWRLAVMAAAGCPRCRTGQPAPPCQPCPFGYGAGDPGQMPAQRRRPDATGPAAVPPAHPAGITPAGMVTQEACLARSGVLALGA